MKGKAFEDVRVRHLACFPFVDNGLETDYEKATGNRFNPNAKCEVANLNEGALKEIRPLFRKSKMRSAQTLEANRTTDLGNLRDDAWTYGERYHFELSFVSAGDWR